jgi:hypothetical protein
MENPVHNERDRRTPAWLRTLVGDAAALYANEA